MLSITEQRYLEFAHRFEADFIAQDPHEARSLDETLDRAWQAAAVLPARELTMVTEQQTARMVLPGNAVEAAIFDVLGQQPVHVDQIGIQAGLPIEQISSTLALMELKGMVRQVGGMRYIAVREAKAAYTVENKKEE